jgi:glucokinase
MTVRGAIDIGGTKMAVGLVDGDRVLARVDLATDAGAGPDAAVVRLADALHDMVERQEVPPVGDIGIACAGPVNVQTGRIENPYSLADWEAIDFPAALGKRCQARAVIEHDVAATLLGCLRQLGRRNATAALAMFGTGVGASVSLCGEIFRNRQPYHPEFGSLMLAPTGSADCVCGRSACADALLSGTALQRRAEKLGLVDLEAALQGSSEKARRFQQQVGRELRLFANVFALTFQPEVFFIGGGVVKAAPAFFQETIASAFDPECLYVAPAEVRVIDDREAALIGAAALCDASTKNQPEEDIVR